VSFYTTDRYIFRFIMESGAKGCEVVVSGKLRAARAKSMKFTDGFMIHSGQPAKDFIDHATRHVLLRQGVLGIKVKIMRASSTPGKSIPCFSAARYTLQNTLTLAQVTQQARSPAAKACQTASQSSSPRRSPRRCSPTRRITVRRQHKHKRTSRRRSSSERARVKAALVVRVRPSSLRAVRVRASTSRLPDITPRSFVTSAGLMFCDRALLLQLMGMA